MALAAGVSVVKLKVSVAGAAAPDGTAPVPLVKLTAPKSPKPALLTTLIEFSGGKPTDLIVLERRRVGERVA